MNTESVSKKQKGNAVLPLVSGSTAKMQFFDEAIKAKRHIAAFHFNDVFLEFADKFYLGKSHKTTIANFKKWMQRAANHHGLKIVVAKVDQVDRVDFGVRNIWSIPDTEYCH